MCESESVGNSGCVGVGVYVMVDVHWMRLCDWIIIGFKLCVCVHVLKIVGRVVCMRVS